MRGYVCFFRRKRWARYGCEDVKSGIYLYLGVSLLLSKTLCLWIGHTKARAVAIVVTRKEKRIGNGVAFAVSEPVQSKFCPISRSDAMSRALCRQLALSFMRSGGND